MTRAGTLAAGCLVLLMAADGRAQAPTAPPIVEIRVHGNHSTPDAEILALSGLAVGQPATDEALETARAKVEASGRFDTVAVRKLARSIDIPDDIMVMVLVEERPGVTPDNLTPGWISRLADGRMFLPILRYEEGYGFTYGLQSAVADIAGPGSRLSVPAMWGGERRIGVEFERPLENPVLSRIAVGTDIQRRVHPAFDIAEERRRVFGRLERRIATVASVGVEAGHDRVRFAGREDDVDRLGAELVVDTRTDPAFPRNAAWGRAGIERLDLVSGVRRRTRADASAALGLPFGSALTVRGFHIAADGALPLYEQTMIGGGLATRGYRRGYRVGDNAAGASVSWALPFGSPLAVVRHGVRTFVDWGATYDAATSLGDAAFDRGAGVGWFANLQALNAYVDVGRGNGKWRLHVRFGTGF